MFSKSSDHEITKISPSGDATTLIANGTSIKGDLNFHGSLEIQGSIAGTITAEDENAQVRVIQGGAVEGKIAVPTVIVNGHVRGDIFATKHALLASKAVVEGNIYYNTLEIERGAHVVGNLVHEIPSTNVSSFQQDESTDSEKNTSS
jgi:cytoskeletal protein CcmA (bactofilin family)|tara:strand:- start:4706 stop:5146 length:441 start_codon:yes stop_codon:yes gene_type:complete